MVFLINKHDVVLCYDDNSDEKVSISRWDGNYLVSAAVLLLMCCYIPGIGGCLLCIDIVCVMNLCILPKLSWWLMHRVDSIIESSLGSKIIHLFIWDSTFVRWQWMIKQFLKIWLWSVNIINFLKILLIFLILRRSRINEVRLENEYLALCKHI